MTLSNKSLHQNCQATIDTKVESSSSDVSEKKREEAEKALYITRI